MDEIWSESVTGSHKKLWLLRDAEISAGAAGLVAGLSWWTIGVAGGGRGCTLLVRARPSAHIPRRDRKSSLPPSVLLVAGGGRGWFPACLSKKRD